MHLGGTAILAIETPHPFEAVSVEIFAGLGRGLNMGRGALADQGAAGGGVAHYGADQTVEHRLLLISETLLHFFAAAAQAREQTKVAKLRK